MTADPEADPTPRLVAPMVTVIVPTLDEAKHLEQCIASILDTRHPEDRFEILIVDGGSTDDTVLIAQTLASRHPQISLLHNPRRIQSSALNLAIAASDAGSELIIRADAHSVFPTDFIASCVASQRRHEADLVVFRAVPVATEGCFRAAVAAAQGSRLGVGNSSYRLDSPSAEVEHGFHGCFRREIFEASGLYDESFTHNEDAELSYRIIQAGGRVFLDRDLAVRYIPRGTVTGLARQYYHYGRGRAANVLKHGSRPRPRQLAPLGLLALEAVALVLVPVLALADRSALIPLVLVLLVGYVTVAGVAGVVNAVRMRSACGLMMPVALLVMHHSWGIGFLRHYVPGLGGRRGS